MMSKRRIKLRPNRFKFDAFDAGLSDIPGGQGKTIEIEIEQDGRPDAKPDEDKTAQELIDDLYPGS